MKNKMIKILIVISLLFNSMQVRAELLSICGFLASPPEFPFQTLIHSFSWDFTDGLLFGTSYTLTSVPVTPPDVIIGNNPRVEYTNALVNFETTHGIVPALPTGTYVISGQGGLFRIVPIPIFPFFTTVWHPSGIKTCNEEEFIP